MDGSTFCLIIFPSSRGQMMNGMKQDEFKQYYETDKKRYSVYETWHFTPMLLYHLRHTQFDKSTFSKSFHKFLLRLLSRLHNLEIPPETKIGKGLYLGHVYNITINPTTIIGDNCNIHKGVTIGMEPRGRRKGTPIIGNNVWIGVNATIVGKINIGDDVLIAPNTFVNCDIPSHSIVIGCPCKIIPRENATKGYIKHF